MEPDIMPLHSSSPPPLDDDNVEAGSEEEEFGGFSDGMPRTALHSSTEPPASLMKPASTLTPDFSPSKHTTSIKSSRSQIEVEGQHCNSEANVHLVNGYAEGHHNSHAASIASTYSREEDAGFADFTVFTEQAAHPWCCGFSPMGDTEQWEGGVTERNTSKKWSGPVCDPEHEVILDSEPTSHCACKLQENGSTKVKHCTKRDAALVQSSQEHCRSQEAALGCHLGEGKRSLNCLQVTEMQNSREKCGLDPDESISECATEDQASLCDDISFDGPSEDIEPNVSSLVSQEDQTDGDQTDVEEEEMGDYRYTDSWVNSRTAALSHCCGQPATQETSATSNRSSVTYTEDEFAEEHHRNRDHAHTGVQILSSLPPSDSFADFCSAPTQEDGDGSWAEFQDQRAQEEGKTWTQLREQVSRLQIDGEEEQGRTREHRGSKSSEESLSCRVQQLLQASFPQAEVAAVEGEEPSLGALLHPQHLPDSEEEQETPARCARAQWVQQSVCWPHQDVHSAVGLQFQWGGSHSNRTLLRCLGVDTSNRVFIGMKRQPVSVPAFASSLGMLEPTKDFVPTVCSPGHTAVTAQAPLGPRDTHGPSTHSEQEPLPSRQLDQSSCGLSSSQDGCSALDLNYFGPEEEESSSSSCSSTPPPGVDRELYELTIIKIETSLSSSHLEDTLKQLMSTAEKTSTSLRTPLQDEELSEEAGRLMSGLPNLSFMHAKVLMFPSVLLPKE